MTGALRNMMGSAAPAWPDIPWHVTDGAAAVPAELGRAAAEERTRRVMNPLMMFWQPRAAFSWLGPGSSRDSTGPGPCRPVRDPGRP